MQDDGTEPHCHCFTKPVTHIIGLLLLLLLLCGCVVNMEGEERGDEDESVSGGGMKTKDGEDKLEDAGGGDCIIESFQ